MDLISTGYKYLVDMPGIRSGRPIVQGTRVAVHDVAGLFLSGSGVGEIVRELPTVTRAQVYECLAYYEDHKADDLLVARQMAMPDRTQ